MPTSPQERDYNPQELSLFDSVETPASKPETSGVVDASVEAPRTAPRIVNPEDASAAFDKFDTNHPLTDVQKRGRAGIASPEDIENEAVRAAGVLLGQTATKEARKRRRGSPDGPPPHIQAEVRRARGY